MVDEIKINEQLIEFMQKRKGFTLIELLIVIGILAVLATTVVLVLNPAQILAETRDTQRISDLGSVNSAIGLYLATVASPDVTGGAAANVRRCSNGVASTTVFGTPTVGVACTGTPSRAVDGTAWVSVNMSNISGGSPLSVLPQDPTASSTVQFYAFAGIVTTNTYELNANMESTKFGHGGSADVETSDGGNNTNMYEIGNDPGLDL